MNTKEVPHPPPIKNIHRLFTQPLGKAQIKETQDSASLAFVKVIHRWPNSPVTGEFPAHRASNEENVPFDGYAIKSVTTVFIVNFYIKPIIGGFFCGTPWTNWFYKIREKLQLVGCSILHPNRTLWIGSCMYLFIKFYVILWRGILR